MLCGSRPEQAGEAYTVVSVAPVRLAHTTLINICGDTGLAPIAIEVWVYTQASRSFTFLGVSDCMQSVI